jgi:hypothetical protein
MYKPLPESVTIKQSGINGLGLFAEQAIMQGTNLGMSHIKLNGTIVRTPLGGFINHANEPNAVKVYKHTENDGYAFMRKGAQARDYYVGTIEEMKTKWPAWFKKEFPNESD